MADFWPKNAISLNPHCHQGNEETMARIQVWYNAVYLRVEATPALYSADWSAAQQLSCQSKETFPVTCCFCIFSQVSDWPSSWPMTRWDDSLIIRKFWACSELRGHFCDLVTQTCFKPERNDWTRAHCWPSQGGYNDPSLRASPAVTHLWVCLKGPGRTGTFHPQQGGCFMIGWDCRREPPVQPYLPLLSAVRTAEHERVRSARQGGLDSKAQVPHTKITKAFFFVVVVLWEDETVWRFWFGPNAPLLQWT